MWNENLHMELGNLHILRVFDLKLDGKHNTNSIFVRFSFSANTILKDMLWDVNFFI